MNALSSPHPFTTLVLTGSLPRIRRYLKTHTDIPVSAFPGSMHWAAEKGRQDIIEHLVKVCQSRFSPCPTFNGALEWASFYGHEGCVRALLPVSDPSSGYTLALKIACEQNQVSVIHLLIPVSRVDSVFIEMIGSEQNLARADILSPHLSLSTLELIPVRLLSHLPAAQARLTRKSLQEVLPISPPPRAAVKRL